MTKKNIAISIGGVLLLALALLVAYTTLPLLGGSTSEVSSTINPEEGITEETVEVTMQDEDDVEVTFNAENVSELDPRKVYTDYLQSFVERISEDPDSIDCSENLKKQLLENPTVIPELNEEHNYFALATGREVGSIHVTVTTAYYKDSKLIQTHIQFVEDGGAITLADVDALLVFMSGDEYVI